jgi:hypothetical protein
LNTSTSFPHSSKLNVSALRVWQVLWVDRDIRRKGKAARIR